MKITSERITPEIAQRYLAHNTGNRALRPGWVETLAEDIRKGRWAKTPTPISFSDTNRLIDGQHRLSAIVKSGVTIELQVARGVPEESYGAFDCGARRAYFERLTLVDGDWKNRCVVRTVTGFVKATRDGVRRNVPLEEIKRSFDKMPQAFVMAAHIYDTPTPGLKSQYIAAALAAYFHVDAAKAQEFQSGYMDGADLEKGSPVLRLRENKLGLTGRVDTPLMYWKSAAAMIAHFEGRALERLVPTSEDMLGNKSESVAGYYTKRAQTASKTRMLKAAHGLNGRLV